MNEILVLELQDIYKHLKDTNYWTTENCKEDYSYLNNIAMFSKYMLAENGREGVQKDLISFSVDVRHNNIPTREDMELRRVNGSRRIYVNQGLYLFELSNKILMYEEIFNPRIPTGQEENETEKILQHTT